VKSRASSSMFVEGYFVFFGVEYPKFVSGFRNEGRTFGSVHVERISK